MRLLISLVALLSAPAVAQVRVVQGESVDYLAPHWVQLDDGSAFALMATSDLKTTVMIRCWDHAAGTYCIKSSESWVADGIPAHSVAWSEHFERPKAVMAVVEGQACSQVLENLTDDGSLPNCQTLLDALYVGGPIALARQPITAIHPRREDIPSALIRRAPLP